MLFRSVSQSRYSKVKDGVSYSEQDYKRAMENFEEAIDGNMQFNARNFDLFLKACRTTAKALFPNFMFLDTPYNTNDKWQANDPKRYRYELATMGCRTREEWAKLESAIYSRYLTIRQKYTEPKKKDSSSTTK